MAKAIQDWDLTDEDGKKIPLEKAKEVMIQIGGEMVVDRKKPLVLVIVECGEPRFFFQSPPIL